MPTRFTHLHVHTEYSLLDGVMPVRNLIATCKEYGMDSVAMTDHGTMFGMVKFYSEAVANGIKPIIGCEVYVAPRKHTDKEHEFDRKPWHLTLLVKNETGFRNLMHLVSVAHTDGFYYKPRIDKQLISQYSDGLIALSACIGGEVPSLILNERPEAAADAARWYNSTFGPGNYYLEIMDQGLIEQKRVNTALIELSHQLSIPLVATNDVHYLKAEDSLAQDVMICIEQGKTLNDSSRLSFQSQEFYLKSPEQMREVFPLNPEALAATIEIADKCNFELDLNTIYLPDFDVPSDFTSDSYLESLTREGLTRKYHPVTADISERAGFELKVIREMGYSEYFLIVWDLLRFARSEGIPVGPGRGSVAGSLVAFALDITKVDPLKYDLLFERFLNPDRVSMPDIDMDFCDRRRERVIEYARQKYGAEKVSMIATFQRLKARAAIRDVGRVLGLELPYVDRIAKLVPAMIPDSKVTIDTAIDHSPELRDLYNKDEDARRLLDISRKIEGRARNVGTHAAGVVISKNKLTQHVPIYTSANLKGAIITQADKDDLEALGLLKMDFLGLRTLSLISDALDFIQEKTGTPLDIDSIPLDDKKTFELFARGDTDGIFQFEAGTVTSLASRSQPTCIEDLTALNALNRPGPLGSGMGDTFIENRKKRPDEIDYMHPLLEPVLRDTFGIMLYQEQVMRTANVIAGFSLAESDNLRRAMGKKKVAEMEKMKKQFVENATAKISDRALAETIYDIILKFSGYGFNKSHSAAYAFIAYQTAFLKTHYPVEFMAALLTSVKGDYLKTEKYIDDCRRMGIAVKPPDINRGSVNFKPDGDTIIYGLSSIKNVGEGAIEALIAERRENGIFKSLYDFCRRVDLHSLNSKTIEAFILSGACDCFDGNRAQKMQALDEALELGRACQRDKSTGQTGLFDDFVTEFADPPLRPVDEFPLKDLLEYEKDLLGLYLSHHPLDPFREWVRKKATTTYARLADPSIEDKMTFTVAGRIVSRRDFMQKKSGEQGVSFELEDFTGRINITAFSDKRREYNADIREGNIVAVRGKVNARQRDGGFNDEARREVSIICNSLESYAPPEPAIDRSQPVRRIFHVRISDSYPGEGSPAEMINELRAMVNAYDGGPDGSDVVVHIQEYGAERLISLGATRVRYCRELLRLAKHYFGDDNAWGETDRT